MIETTHPEWVATLLRTELSINDDDPVDFNRVFGDLDIRAKEIKLKDGTLGACKVVGLKKFVVVSSEIIYESQKRFTLAHELGHVIIHHGSFLCKEEDLSEWRTRQDKEMEANQFAAAFLLPKRVASEQLKKSDISFTTVQSLAEKYGISLTSSLIRLIKMSPDSVCAFFQVNGRVKYCVKSPDLSFSPKKGMVEDISLANTLSETSLKAKGTVDYNAWFEEVPSYDEIECTEESWYFSRLNQTISIVYVNTDKM